jgi:hypothetical protein
MKLKLSYLFFLLTAPLLHGQATPSLMSYQGRVTDAAGVLIGNTSPVNRSVVFRLYSASSGGTVLYAETQTVTISGGEFGVLIGNGAGITGSPGPGAPATTPYKTLSDIVNSGTYSSLYLGVTVDDGTAAADLEISPRQQMVSGAFALRAKVAESVAGGAVTTTMIGDGQVSTGKIASGAVDSSRILDSSIVFTDIANNTITAGKLDTSTIGLWNPVGSSVYRSSGNVGIGEANPGFPLNFASSFGDKISLYGNSGAHYGFGMQTNVLQIHSDTSSSDIAFGYGSSAAMTETMRIKGNGNVGIGTSNPGDKLVVVGNLRVYNSNNPVMVVANSTGQGLLAVASTAGSWSANATTNDVVLRSDSTKLILQSGGSGAGIVIDTGNNVTVPNTLSVGRINATNAIVARSGNYNGSNGYTFDGSGDQDGGLFSPGDGTLTMFTNGSERLRITPSGYVGIGTSNPTTPLHVANTALTYVNATGTINGGNTNPADNFAGNLDVSIKADGSIVGYTLYITSDERIKEDLHPSDSVRDLATLQELQVTDYQLKDKLLHGGRPQKKLIAQQVKSSYPQAVSRGTNVIPDILQKAVCEDGWVELASDLQVGERIRLLGSQEEIITEVLELRPGGFRTAFNPADGKVYVYGREVDDFLYVDYDAIAMLNVSATQQIKKDSDAAILALQAKNAALEARLSALEKLLSAAK